jgi:hypothetical protein
MFSLIDEIKKKTRMIFDETGVHPPLFILSLKKGIKLMPCFWSNVEDKKQTVILIKDMIGNGELKSFYFISEAWSKSCDSITEVRNEYMKHGSLEFAENRKEILMIQYQSINENNMFMAEIIRGDEGPKVGEWKKMNDHSDKNELSFGLFDNLFTIANAVNN